MHECKLQIWVMHAFVAFVSNTGGGGATTFRQVFGNNILHCFRLYFRYIL